MCIYMDIVETYIKADLSLEMQQKGNDVSLQYTLTSLMIEYDIK